MKSKEIRDQFLNFFASKQHAIVPSAPMVVKNDPTLMFTNAGMNQFKDIFLGNSPAKDKRVADSQKCLRVSGKHNDLEEVGHDTYHHTMFEMLGNWSFGDYFKKDAIDWAWELLADIYKIPKDRMYATVFGGDKKENLEPDNEAKELWQKYLEADRIIYGSKKDNFWEMGETGPCGPCSEIHVDIRTDGERKKVDGATLVNTGHPHVIEIWNLVFIQFNRKASGELELLPDKHVDTGMGFERLCMVVQGKQSNYDTDVFQTIIEKISNIANISYGKSHMSDVAMRVIADHLRTICFAIADGQLPSNNKAGYVIRRILRRAVRYAYSYLHIKEPFMGKLLPVLILQMGEQYPELNAQKNIIEKVVFEEESSFLRTLETGIKLLDSLIAKAKESKSDTISGKSAFELYDTFGFPLDLTELILREQSMQVNKPEFDEEMEKQKSRSRDAATLETDDWQVVNPLSEGEFVGYDTTETEVQITRWRKIKTKTQTLFHIVTDKTPFYAESGGQVGDTGLLQSVHQNIEIIDTKKENNLGILIATEAPQGTKYHAIVNKDKRTDTANNHSATHLMHEALRNILGTHVEQKGSFVCADYLRFDFSHFQKVTDEELQKAELIVNTKIRENLLLDENRAMPIEQAKKLGAMALFGEKYGDNVRVIKFGSSVELCGGTHVPATGRIGYFKIVSESAVAAGIRRIEAITGRKAEEYIRTELDTLKEIRNSLKNNKEPLQALTQLQEENQQLKKQIEVFLKEKAAVIKESLKSKIENINGVNYLSANVKVDSAQTLKDIAFQLKAEVDNLFFVAGANIAGKANISIMISDNLVKDKNLHAGKIISELAKEIGGSGGGQPFFASAGGNNPAGIDAAISKAKSYLK